jgi:thymidylate synthase ThyX
MTITAKVIADTIFNGNRITTMQLRFHRFILPEFLTHRAFSRNASSSRAIPVERLIQDVENDPAMPIHWGSNKPGMQAGDELESGKEVWQLALEDAVYWAKSMARMGYHKQIVNRILEPFAHINVLVTATEWDNFFGLRDHPDAQPEIQALAKAMRKARDESLPVESIWHTPYCDDLKRSAARCARVSYLTHEGKEPTYEQDIALFDRLAHANPMHSSPMEHQAIAIDGWCRNFKGWRQFRDILEVK